MEAFKQFTPKGFPVISFFFSVNCFCLHEMSFFCPKYVCSYSQIAIQYVARVPHFSTFSFFCLLELMTIPLFLASHNTMYVAVTVVFHTV